MPKPDQEIGAAWIHAGGAHHTGFSMALSSEYMEDFTAIAGIEYILIDSGNFEDVVLGCDNLEDYIKNNPYFGAVVGRYGNRLDEGKIKIGDKEYQLDVNDGENHLHGGTVGFDKVIWEAEKLSV